MRTRICKKPILKALKHEQAKATAYKYLCEFQIYCFLYKQGETYVIADEFEQIPDSGANVEFIHELGKPIDNS